MLALCSCCALTRSPIVTVASSRALRSPATACATASIGSSTTLRLDSLRSTEKKALKRSSSRRCRRLFEQLDNARMPCVRCFMAKKQTTNTINIQTKKRIDRALSDGERARSEAAFASRVDVGLVQQQLAHNVDVTEPRRIMQCRQAAPPSPHRCTMSRRARLRSRSSPTRISFVDRSSFEQLSQAIDVV